MARWRRITNKSLAVILLILMVFLTGCGGNSGPERSGGARNQSSGCTCCTCDKGEETDSLFPDNENNQSLDEHGSYTSKEDVADYLIRYGRLPDNFITKKEAKKLGWHGGGLDSYAPGMCIGGDYFGNYEKRLPVVKGRTYHECDIDTLGAKQRGSKRIVYSDDGNIYYTEDHYNTFTLLHGDDQ